MCYDRPKFSAGWGITTMPTTMISGSQGTRAPHWAFVAGMMLVFASLLIGILIFLGEEEAEPAKSQETSEPASSPPAPTATQPATAQPQRQTTSPSTSQPRSTRRIANELATARQALIDGDYDTAIRSYRAVLALDPNNSRARSGLANARLIKEDREREEEQRQRQVREQLMKADEAMKRGDYSAAIAAYEAALALDPDNEEIRRGLQKAREASKPDKPNLDTASLAPLTEQWRASI